MSSPQITWDDQAVKGGQAQSVRWDDEEKHTQPPPDTTPESEQGPMRRFAERAFGIPDRVFDHPSEYLNPFSRSYWSHVREQNKQSHDAEGEIPGVFSKLGPFSKAFWSRPSLADKEQIEWPGKQTIADIKAKNYAGAVGDVLPDAFAVAQLAVPTAGKMLQRPFVARNAPRAGRVVGGTAGYKAAGWPGAVAGGAVGDLAARGLTKLAPWMAKSVGVPVSRPGVFAPDTSVRMGPLTEPETTQPGVYAPDTSINRPMQGPAARPSEAAPAPYRLSGSKLTAPATATPKRVIGPERQLPANVARETPVAPPAAKTAPTAPAVDIAPVPSNEPLLGGKELHEIKLNVSGTQKGSLMMRDAASIKNSGLPDKSVVVRSSMVAPELRGQGHGKSIYEAAAKYAKEGGADFLASDTELSPQAERVWKSLAKDDPAHVSTVGEGLNRRYMLDLRETPPVESPNDLNQYYGKTRQIGMETPHELLKPHQRQLESPTFSTAPVPKPSTPNGVTAARPTPSWSFATEPSKLAGAEQPAVSGRLSEMAKPPAPTKAPASQVTAPPAKSAAGINDFAANVKKVAQSLPDTKMANGESTFQGKVSIADVYDAYGKDYPDAGSLASFKERLVKAAQARKLNLSRLDMPEYMDHDMRLRSAAEWGNSHVHFIVNQWK